MMPPSSSQKKDDLMKMDLYKLLNVPEDANAKQIKKAYRLKALECHPDKNPDNPRAAEVFHQLSEALKILSDAGARAAYDHLRKAKKAAQERTEKLDAKRRKVKEDLEAREQAAEKAETRQAKTTLKQEIERLREEGSRILEEEQMKMREQLKQEKIAAEDSLRHRNQTARLKLKWKVKKDDPTNGGYSHDLLMKMFSKYCDVTALFLSKKKQGSAVIELQNSKAAKLAMSAELGIPTNPIRISWISGDTNEAPGPTGGDEETKTRSGGGDSESILRGEGSKSIPTSLFPSATAPRAPSHGSFSTGDDFESAVLMRLKQAQERKRMERDAEQEGST